MRTFDPDIEDQLDSGKIDRRDALIFVLDEGTFGFVAGVMGTLTFNVGGVDVDFVGAGSLLSLYVPESDVKQTQEAVEVSISTKYEVDGTLVELISVDALSGIEDLSWYRRPALVGRLWVSDAGGVIDFEQLRRCEIHEILHTEDDAKGYTVTGRLQTVEVFRRLVDAKTRNGELQQLIDPTDRGLEAVSKMATDTVYWGRKDPAQIPAETPKKKRSGK